MRNRLFRHESLCVANESSTANGEVHLLHRAHRDTESAVRLFEEECSRGQTGTCLLEVLEICLRRVHFGDRPLHVYGSKMACSHFVTLQFCRQIYLCKQSNQRRHNRRKGKSVLTQEACSETPPVPLVTGQLCSIKCGC